MFFPSTYNDYLLFRRVLDKFPNDISDIIEKFIMNSIMYSKIIYNCPTFQTQFFIKKIRNLKDECK